MSDCTLIFPHQLFDPHPALSKDRPVILIEDGLTFGDPHVGLRFHKQKIVLIFSAMSHFAAELRGAGWTVDYVKLTDEGNSGSFTGEIARAIERHDPRAIHVVEASEWRVQQAIEEWHGRDDAPVHRHGLQTRNLNGALWFGRSGVDLYRRVEQKPLCRYRAWQGQIA